MRNDLYDSRLINPVVEQGLKIRPLTQTLGATWTMDADMPPLQLLDPGGAGRTVLLPPEAAGLLYIIVNLADADEDLTVKEDADATTIGVIEQGTMGIFVCGLSAAGTATWYDMTVPQEVSVLSAVTATAAELNYNDITTLGTGAASKAVVLDSGEDYVWPAAGILTYGVLKDPAGTTLGATVAELNAAADVSARLISIPDAATYTCLVANSGKPHVLPDLGQDCLISLPAVASGLEYEFYYKGIAADTSDWNITTGSDTNFYLGGVAHLDTDANDAGDEVVPVPPDGNSNSIAQILVPDVGTRVKVICDGTNWIITGASVSATAPTFADQ